MTVNASESIRASVARAVADLRQQLVRVGRQLAGLLERQQAAAEEDLYARVEDVALRRKKFLRALIINERSYIILGAHGWTTAQRY